MEYNSAPVSFVFAARGTAFAATELVGASAPVGESAKQGADASLPIKRAPKMVQPRGGNNLKIVMFFSRSRFVLVSSHVSYKYDLLSGCVMGLLIYYV
jgi:hypothetical protein